jgi:hypothetical protein
MFMNLHVPEGLVEFWDATIAGARIDFSLAMLGTGAIHFHGCHLRSGEILFDQADLFGTVVNLWRAYFYPDGPKMLFPQVSKPIILLDVGFRRDGVDLNDNRNVFLISSAD